MTKKKQTKIRTKPHRNPYREEQAAQRKTANLARRAVLQKERSASIGDPIRSLPTPFIESLALGRMPDEVGQNDKRPLNHFLSSTELTEALAYSKRLSKPYLTESERAQSKTSEPSTKNDQTSTNSLHPLMNPHRNPHIQEKEPEMSPTQRLALHELDHINATRALTRIAALSNGSSADRTRHNIQRCISTFGRHNTDAVLPPRPPSIQQPRDPAPPKVRAGPDTGSSEVQIAVLTTKINALADNLRNKDKHNKKNLRLLVHRRQKLLKYLFRSERGGARWRNVAEGLGIQDGMWRAEISI